MKTGCVLLTCVLVTMCCSSAFAEEKSSSMMGAEMMQGKAMEEKEMTAGQERMWPKECWHGAYPRCGMAMKTMMEKSLIATDDGGVVVLMGTHLMKYDKKLTLIKEVELPVDMQAMQENMATMMKKCDMMQEDMMKNEKQAQ